MPPCDPTVPLVRPLARAGLACAAAAVVGLGFAACNSPSGEKRQAPIAAVSDEEPLARRGDGSDALEYTLSFADAHKHMIDVELSVPRADSSEIVLMLATWTPGSYLIREYARQLEGLSATDASGSKLAVKKVRKNRWRVSGGSGDASIRYRVYAREMSVRTNFVDDEVAVVVPAATFVTVIGRQQSLHDVKLVLRPGWSTSVTGLDASGASGSHQFVARSFDELVDSPIVIGNAIDTSFESGGKQHRIATFSPGHSWDAKKSTDDVAKIVREQQAFWAQLPYRDYVFQNVLLSSGGMGGLEHLDSTLLLANRSLMSEPKRYRSWLGLVSHEFFHTWNGKRLRPVTLGPFDYENEIYTEDLWIVEGLTSYYDDLTLARTGLYSEKQYLEALGSQISSLQRTPGRLTQPLASASYDAWIKHYRRDENTVNTAISYYTKGAVVGFILDATIRRATRGARSLDDVMRQAHRRYGGERGYTSAEFRQLASDVAGTDLSEFFRSAVDTTDELNYDAALAFYGLRFKPIESKAKKNDGKSDAYLGVNTSSKGVVSRVTRETPAYSAGLNVDDELLAIDGERIDAKGLETLLDRHKPGDEVDVLIARRKRVRTIRVVLGSEPKKRHDLERMPSRSAAQAGRAAAWLAPVAR